MRFLKEGQGYGTTEAGYWFVGWKSQLLAVMSVVARRIRLFFCGYGKNNTKPG